MGTKVKDINGNEIDFEAAVNLMDDDLREQASWWKVPCTEQEFLEAYVQLHEEKYGEHFAPYAGLAW